MCHLVCLLILTLIKLIIVWHYRYSDFNVYEIDTNHAVIHMTNTTPVEENDQPIVQHDLLSETDRLKLRQVADNDSNTESIQIKVHECMHIVVN